MSWSNLADDALNSVTGNKFWVSTVHYPNMYETVITASKGLFGGAGSMKNWRYTDYAFDEQSARENHKQAFILAMNDAPDSWTISPQDIKVRRDHAITRAQRG